MSKFSYKSLFTILFFLLIAIVVLLKFIFPNQKVSAAWWNDGWQYRKAINIGNSGVAQTNTQIKILDNYDLSALVTAGKIQSDLDDLRFTDVDGKVLNYWIEDATNNSADVWGILTSLPASGSTIYMYYGNLSATGISSTTNITIGGTMTSVGGYRIHTFKGNGTLTNAKAENAEVLVVAGGGGGATSQAGSGGGGGGGAGGLTYNASYSLTKGQIINITVGVGGTNGGTDLNQSGSDGTNSIFGSITTNGGGGGARTGTNGRPGGSGGGGGYNGYATVRYGGSGVVGIGNSGGNTTDLASASGAGGGGAGGIGGNNKASHNGGDAGLGINYSITGVGVTYASGGRGGGGSGAVSSPANTGKGGDGAYAQAVAASGASGIVVVRYLSGASAIPAAEEIGGGPIAYWKFDEGIGTTIFDSTSNKRHGILGTGFSSPTWQIEDQCIVGKCLYFDGNGDKFKTILFSQTFNGLTGEAWIKSNTTTVGSYSRIISTDSWNPGFIMSISDTNKFRVFLWDDAEDSISSNANINDNKWHHIAFTINTTNGQMVLYIDGKLDSSKTSTITSPIISSAKTISFADDMEYKGFLDEVKIYPYTRTAAQIKLDYNAGKAHAGTSEGTSSSLGSNNKNNSLSDGLVGYWKMDENTGTTTADSSGLGYTGTFGTGDSAPSWSSGKYGIGTSFDGINDYIDAGNILNMGTNDMTISTWIKSTSTAASQFTVSKSLAAGQNYRYAVGTSNTVAKIFMQGDGGPDINFTGTKLINDGNWHNIIYVFDRDGKASIYVDGVYDIGQTISQWNGKNMVSTNPFRIGAYTASDNTGITSPFSGLLDEVRIYNRALSPNEVESLYNYAPGPVAYWNFNEGSGSKINDISGLGSTGTWQGTLGNQWSQGKYGQSGKFNGSNNYVDIGDNLNYYTPYGLTFTTWIKRTGNLGVRQMFAGKGTGGTANATPFWLELNTSNQLIIYLNAISGSPSVSCTATDKIINDTNWHYITFTWDGTTVKIYLDGMVSSVTCGLTGQMNNYALAASLGKLGTGGLHFTGQLDEFKIYNYARTAKQIIEDMNAGAPSTSTKSILAYYKFDEGYGTTTANWGNAGIGRSGIFGTGNSAPTWTNNGKFGKALSFNGAGTNIVIPTLSGISQTTWSVWIKPNNTNEMHIIKSNGASDYMLANTSGKAFKIRTFSGTGDIFTTSGLLPINQWSQLAMVYTNPGIKLYLNGKLDVQSSTYTMGGLNGSYQLGRYGGVEPDFNGLMDEVKIYNYALTSDEIKQDYNQGASFQMGATTQTIGATITSLDYCIPGDTSYCASPVAEYKMDEGIGTTAFDTSGNNINTGFSGTPTWIQGKTGKALSFNGTTDFLKNTRKTLSGALTFGVWIKTTSTDSSVVYGGNAAQNIIGDTTGGVALGFGIHGGKVRYNQYTGIWESITGNISVNDGLWHYISVTHKSSSGDIFIYVDGKQDVTGNLAYNGSNAYDVIARGYAGDSFNGQLDQIRIYNYARTPAQIAYDYNKGAPVGWWKFDECQGNIAYDWSGIGNTGVISIGASGTQTSLGTCQVGTSAAWTNGSSGKLNSSLNFDGVDDYVLVNQPNIQTTPNYFTVTGYINPENQSNRFISPNSAGRDHYVAYDPSNQRMHIAVAESGDLNIRNRYSTSNSVPLNQWTHFAISINDKNIKIYINGILNAEYNEVINIAGWSSSWYIGQRGISTSWYKGKMDDLRVYNYALTSEQVKILYNGGGVSFN